MTQGGAMFAIAMAGLVATSEHSEPTSFCPAAERAESYPNQSLRFLKPGRQGWIFRDRTDLRPPRAVSAGQAVIFRRLSASLAARGTSLALVIVPPRGLLAADMVSTADGTFDPVRIAEAYRRIVSDLGATGAIVPDLHAAAASFPGPDTPLATYFLPDDSHWSPMGAAHAAAAVSHALKAAGVHRGTANVAITPAPAEPSPGNFRSTLETLCGTSPAAVRVPRWTTQSPENSDLLQTTATPEIVLVGTSYSNMRGTDWANFAGALRRHMAHDILNLAQPGGGADQAMLAWLDNDALTDWPKALIWEFPSHMLPDEEALLTIEAGLERRIARHPR